MIAAFTTAFLDAASTLKGPRMADCAITLNDLGSVSLAAEASSPTSGALEIDGLEDKAPISIDGVRKGFIKQTFIVSAGTHRWQTMKCNETIQIASNDVRRVYCSTK